VSESLKKVEEINKRLDSLGDPTKKRENETPGVYVDRVETTIRLRSLGVHHLHQEVEKALQAKYTMQDACQAYEGWNRRMTGAVSERPKRLREEMDKMNKDVTDYRANVIVLADLIKKQAESQQPPDSAKAKEMEGYCTNKRLGSVTDAAQRSANFSSLTTLADKQSKFDELTARLEEATLIARDLKTVYIPEAEGFKESLPPAHKAAFDELKKTLDKNKEGLQRLELMASRLSMKARITRELLASVRPKDIGRVLRKEDVDKANDAVEQINNSLGSFQNVTEGPNSKSLPPIADLNSLLDAATSQISQASAAASGTTSSGKPEN